MVKIIGCQHVAFIVNHDVHRLSREAGGPVEMFTLAAQITCYDCGAQFAPVEVELKLTGKDDLNRPQLQVSPGAMRPAGGGKVN